MDNQTHHASDNAQTNFEWKNSTEQTERIPSVNRLKTATIALLSSLFLLSSCWDKSDYEEASKDFIKSEKELKKAQKKLKKAQKDYQDALEEYNDAKEDVKEESDNL